MKYIQILITFIFVYAITSCSKPDDSAGKTTKPKIGPYGYITAQSDFGLEIHKSQDVFVKENDCELGIRIDGITTTLTNDIKTTTFSYSYVLYEREKYKKGKGSREWKREVLHDEKYIERFLREESNGDISFDNISISWSPCGRDEVYIYFKAGQKFKIQDDYIRFIQQFED